MGIIDVKAAFDYLVGQGNTPADPTLANDALLINVKMAPPAQIKIQPILTMPLANTLSA